MSDPIQYFDSSGLSPYPFPFNSSKWEVVKWGYRYGPADVRRRFKKYVVGEIAKYFNFEPNTISIVPKASVTAGGVHLSGNALDGRAWDEQGNTVRIVSDEDIGANGELLGADAGFCIQITDASNAFLLAGPNRTRGRTVSSVIGFFGGLGFVTGYAADKSTIVYRGIQIDGGFSMAIWPYGPYWTNGETVLAP